MQYIYLSHISLHTSECILRFSQISVYRIYTKVGSFEFSLITRAA